MMPRYRERLEQETDLVPITVRVPSQLVAEIRDYALNEGDSTSGIVSEGLYRACDARRAASENLEDASEAYAVDGLSKPAL